MLGFSQGSVIAQTLAVEHPEQEVDALMLACTTCRSNPGTKDILEERIRQARTTGPEAAARLTAKGIFSACFAASQPAAIECFVKWRAAMDQDAVITATRAAYNFDVSSSLRAVSVPSVFIVW